MSDEKNPNTNEPTRQVSPIDITPLIDDMLWVHSSYVWYVGFSDSDSCVEVKEMLAQYTPKTDAYSDGSPTLLLGKRGWAKIVKPPHRRCACEDRDLGLGCRCQRDEVMW